MVCMHGICCDHEVFHCDKCKEICVDWGHDVNDSAHGYGKGSCIWLSDPRGEQRDNDDIKE